MFKLSEDTAAVGAAAFIVILFLGMLVSIELGRRIGKRRLSRDPDRARTGLEVVETAVFALFGLIIAFTFFGAASRFDARRQMIAEEANAIGTAYLRVDLLSPDAQPPLRALFRDYMDLRISAYRKLPSFKAAMAEHDRSEALQQRIWAAAVAATTAPGAHPDAGKLVVPALNDMIDVTTTRLMGAEIHPPLVVYGLLLVLALFCSTLAGHAMAAEAERSWLHVLGFALITVITVWAILDIEYPRVGMIRIHAYDQVLLDLRATMH